VTRYSSYKSLIHPLPKTGGISLLLPAENETKRKALLFIYVTKKQYLFLLFNGMNAIYKLF